MAYNSYILVTITFIGGVMQFTFRRYEKLNPELNSQVKKSKRKAIFKFIAKKGLITGMGLGVATIFVKEGFILLKGKLSLLNNNPEIVVITKSKSIGQIAISKNAIWSLISGAFIGVIWIIRSEVKLFLAVLSFEFVINNNFQMKLELADETR